jgi:hypothetical protein
MEDARAFLPPSDSSRRTRAGWSGRFSLPAAVAVALTGPGPHDSGSPLPGAGWILGAGVTALVLAWLLSRLGRRRTRRAAVTWGRRSGEIDLLGAVLGFHAVTDGSMDGDDGPSSWQSLERIAPERGELAERRVRRVSPARMAAPGPRPPAAPGRPRLVHERLGFVTPRRPSVTTAWLHLVSGETPALTARAACTVAADLIERGGRVLMVDAGRRCLLHARFAREARWGLGECLDGSLPVLGVVQDTGHGGLHLLARGGEPTLTWHALGRLADEAHAHFEHVLLALDPDVPHEAGVAIAGRLVEGWWAGERLTERNARALSERLGVVFSAMPLDAESERLYRSALGAPTRVTVAAAPAPAPAVAEAIPVAELVPLEIAAALDEQPVTSGDHAESMVLDCDGDVRARLEFLIWVRRMTGDAPARPPAWQLADAGVPV